MRGVVEGFYGPPWSHAERLSLLGWLARQGLDTYVYAPKNDVHHRRRWREPYGTEAMARFGELFAEGERQGVRVWFGLAPARLLGWNNVSRLGDRDGDGIGDGGWEALEAKLLAMQRVGARRFALLFDDTATTWVPALGGRSLGRFHARVVLKARALLRREDAEAEVLLVPAAYAGTWASLGRAGRAYWSGLSELGDAAAVAWTGPKVFSPRIAGEDHAELERQTGLRVVVWNNAVANDWVHLATGEIVGLRGWRKLSFGPVANLDAGMVGAGMLLNGALEPRLFRASTATMAAWARDPGGYSAEAAHRVALEEAGPAELADLYDLVARHLLVEPGRREARGLDRAVRAGDRGELRAALDAVMGMAAALDEAEPALRAEVGPTIDKARRLATAGLAALEGRGDEARRMRAEARRIRWFVARRPFARLARGEGGGG